MDYAKLGEEYLEEAGQLRERVRKLRKRAKNQNNSKEKILLVERISLLNAMYLECRDTGGFLAKCGVSR